MTLKHFSIFFLSETFFLTNKRNEFEWCQIFLNITPILVTSILRLLKVQCMSLLIFTIYAVCNKPTCYKFANFPKNLHALIFYFQAPQHIDIGKYNIQKLQRLWQYGFSRGVPKQAERLCWWHHYFLERTFT